MISVHVCTSVVDPEGGSAGTPPPNLINFLFIPFCITMLKNKAQIAGKIINNPRASRALKQAPAIRDFVVHICDVCACTLYGW